MNKTNTIKFNNKMSVKSMVDVFKNADINQPIVITNTRKELKIVIEPHENGCEFGYIGVCNGHIIKSFNRLDIISQFFSKYWMGN